MYKRFNIITLTDIALIGTSIAGIDKSTTDFVKKIPERYKDVQAIISGEFNQISERGTSMVTDLFLGMLDKDSLFGRKSKEMFQIVQRHPPLTKYIYSGFHTTTIYRKKHNC